jgi:DNA processing protein
MPINADSEFWLRLEAVPGLGPEAATRLLEAFDTVGAICAASVSQLSALIGPTRAAALHSAEADASVRTGLAWLAAADAHLIAITDPEYPEALQQCAGAPPWLYIKGDPTVLTRPLLAIVGSRNASVQGQRDADAFAETLSSAGLTIVSGLAEGVDTAAHRGGLRGNGSGVAIVGTGLDRVYPAKNRDLAHQLAQRGAIVSEFPIGTPPRPGHFPRRNRIISGLALGVLVVEAAMESGSLITARLAGEQGREVFALPGSIHNPLARGCHRLIRDGAKLVESANDILEELRFILPPSHAALTPAFTPISVPDSPLMALLTGGTMSFDTLLAQSGLTVDTLSAMLLTHELEGRVARLPGDVFQRLY